MSSVSNAASSRPGIPPEWDGLELAVRRLLDDQRGWRRRAGAAERRLKELETTIAQLKAGGLDPIALRGRVEQLEAENRDLHARLAEAAAHVRRLLARASFLEEER